MSVLFRRRSNSLYETVANLCEDAEADSALPPPSPDHAPLAAGALLCQEPSALDAPAWIRAGGGPTPRVLMAVPTATYISAA